MGVLLLAGSAVIAVTLVHRMSSRPPHGVHQTSLPAHVNVALPNGSRIVATFAMDDRLAVQISGADGDSVLLVDPATGTILETISLGLTGSGTLPNSDVK
jgi:hypothetical protein